MATHTKPSIPRPDPVRWLWYTFGGELGPNYHAWVLRDTTTRTRWLRQIAESGKPVRLDIVRPGARPGKCEDRRGARNGVASCQACRHVACSVGRRNFADSAGHVIRPAPARPVGARGGRHVRAPERAMDVLCFGL